VISRVVNGFDPCRRAGALVVLILAVVASGCGSTEQNDKSNGTRTGVAIGADKLLKPQDRYRYEGAGTERRKVEISRKERVKLLHEAAKKAD
jgi:hypothetical protein